MKNFVTTIFLALVVSGAYAQDKRFVFGITSSLDYNSYVLSGHADASQYRGRFNYSGGLVGRYAFGNRIIGSFGIAYATRNYNKKFSFPVGSSNPGDPTPIEAHEEVSYINRYADIPLDLNVRLSKVNSKVDIYSIIGLVSSVQISHDNKSNGPYFSDSHKVYHDYLFSIKAGAGFLFKAGPIGILFEPQARFYFYKMNISGSAIKPVYLGLDMQLLKRGKFNR